MLPTIVLCISILSFAFAVGLSIAMVGFVCGGALGVYLSDQALQHEAGLTIQSGTVEVCDLAQFAAFVDSTPLEEIRAALDRAARMRVARDN
jgi:hypothetical protein